MAQPVWVLSVDLQTKTATFQTGMADAARAARGSFSDIKDGARSMGSETGYSMMEARHGVMMLGEEFGIHLPRGLTSFIASLGPVGSAMEAAFPFLAIAAGATLLLEHLSKLKEAGDKLTENQVKFGTAVQNAFNILDSKLLEAGIRADELNGNHLSALKKQLELIDRQSMDELVRSFDLVAKAADVVFAELKTSWYQFDAGSAHAQHTLVDFKAQYEALLASGKDKEASDLLAGTRKSAEHTLEMMKQAKDSQAAPDMGKQGNYGKYVEAINELKKAGLSTDEKEVQSYTKLVETLQAQETLQGKIAQLKTVQSSNATQTVHKQMDSEAAEKARQEAEAERQIQEEAGRLEEQAYHASVERLQEAERQKIEATHEGSAARLAAIDAAIRNEENHELTETGFYRSLLTSRVATIRQMGEEQKSITQKLADEDLQLALSEGTRIEKAAQELARHKLAIHRISESEEVKQQTEAQNTLLSSEIAALDRRIAALDKSDEKYLTKLREFENKKKELTQQSGNEVNKIEQAADEKRVSTVTQAYNRMGEAAASTAAKSIIQGRNLGAAFEQMAGNMLQSALTNLMQIETVQGRKRLGDARTAAADAYEKAGNPILGSIEAGVAFAAVMAFNTGGLVPGVGNTDIVPAMLTPGETVLPKAMTENLSRATDSGNSGGDHYTVHVRPTYHVQTIDGDGMRAALNKHTDVLQKHFESAVRKMNR
jgi:DNA repair exonuclease SbcCD ATPase subunit